MIPDEYQTEVARARSREEYQSAFERERAVEYPELDAVERRLRHSADRAKLEEAARVLACPVKKNPPNWQHGRLLYAALCWRIRSSGMERSRPSALLVLDIGTAKGFSALCMEWACYDTGREGEVAGWLLNDWNVVSVDVIDPLARVPRNTVAEVDGLKTLAETLEPWPEARRITFLQSTGVDWLKRCGQRVHFAFIDGKHHYDAVQTELRLLARVQRPGDMVVLDDLQIPGVRKALYEARGFYDWSEVTLKAAPRAYALATRKL